MEEKGVRLSLNGRVGERERGGEDENCKGVERSGEKEVGKLIG